MDDEIFFIKYTRHTLNDIQSLIYSDFQMYSNIVFNNLVEEKKEKLKNQKQKQSIKK